MLCNMLWQACVHTAATLHGIAYKCTQRAVSAGLYNHVQQVGRMLTNAWHEARAQLVKIFRASARVDTHICKSVGSACVAQKSNVTSLAMESPVQV